ncbi:MAG TPA: DmsE family decaheme c-type cytochrome [Pyrinomonadaceae bacterium]|jgi:predicted CXXCH cytochrome family protein|nr:DmsE family decaheme c-type cytochrome [Pyrinomonadaceae bacterium]
MAQSAIGDKCVSCHRAYVQSFLLEAHGKTAKFLHDSRAATCETCHGDGAKHIENREKRIAAADIDNPSELKTPEQRRRANARCLECHSGDRDHFSWHGSEHDRSDMSCMSCHNVHHAKFAFGALASQQRALINGAPADAAEIKTPDKMLISFSVEETCFGCHADKRKAFFQRSTHLFRTELHNMKVGCTSCHNPHGGEGGKMLVDYTVNNVCYTCHAEKRGPFLWDHPPVRENCLNCHSPHGSNNPKLLTARVHLLCQQCHIHMLPRHSTTAGQALDIWSINRGCANCHGQVHGSNHPGGRTLTR